jgi:tetratricopeptide (TPR) repeat protein
MAQAMPDNPENFLAIGLIAMQTNDLDSAEANLTKALALHHPDEGSVRFHLGQLAEARGRPEQALTWYQSVTQGRQQLDAQLRAAVVMGKQGRIVQAQDLLANLSPDDDAGRVQVAQTEAQIMRDAKNYEGVVAALTKALEKMPDAAELLYDRAMAAEKVNRLDMMETDLRRLIKLKPDYAHAYNALGYTLADRTPRIKEALELLDKALKLEPDDPFILDSMGWALFKAKRYGEAVDYLRRAHTAKADPEIAAHLGEALWLKGDKEEARRIWKGSLQVNPDNESLRETTSRLMP